MAAACTENHSIHRVFCCGQVCCGTSDLSSFCRGPVLAAWATNYRVCNRKGMHIRHQAVYPAVIHGQALGMLPHSPLSTVAFAFAALFQDRSAWTHSLSKESAHRVLAILLQLPRHKSHPVCGLITQVGHFLEGLCIISEWPMWFDDTDNETLNDLKLVLRPMVVGDFGRHLAGTLAPLDVDDWRQATVTKDFWYQNAQQVGSWLTCACCTHLKAWQIAVGGVSSACVTHE